VRDLKNQGLQSGKNAKRIKRILRFFRVLGIHRGQGASSSLPRRIMPCKHLKIGTQVADFSM
jgi:hypothetical protein